MTVIATSVARNRIHPGAARAYTIPIVRELPAQPAGTGEPFTW
jgi:hypothetical protein